VVLSLSFVFVKARHNSTPIQPRTPLHDSK
jgi:hypothetical protein